MLKVEHPETLASERRADIERGVGAIFPDDYRNFLESTNGGRPAVPAKVATLNGEVITDLKVFLGDRASYEQNLLKTFAVLEYRLPEKSVPIARDSGGNFLILDCTKPDSGAVYFFPTDSGEEESPPSLAALTKVAESFRDLVSRLKTAIR